MSILSKATTGRRGRAQKVVIYGPEGFGKSTLGSLFPAPLFLDVEGGTSQIDVLRLDREALGSLGAVDSVLTEIVKERPCETLIVDTIDWLEQMALDAIIADAGNPKIQGIEDFGYGKGYTILKERITILLARFDAVIHAGISVVLLAHSKVTKFEPPDGAGPYDRYELKLSKQVAPLIKEWADMLLFGNWRVQVREKDKNDAGAQFKGVGGKERLLHCVRSAAWDAKNRHGMADMEKWGIDPIRTAFERVGAAWGVAAQEATMTAAPNVATGADAGTASAPLIQASTAASTVEGAEDQELQRICGQHEAAVNAYLMENKRVKPDQTWRDLDAAFVVRVKKNPAGFLKVALANGKAVAA